MVHMITNAFHKVNPFHTTKYLVKKECPFLLTIITETDYERDNALYCHSERKLHVTSVTYKEIQNYIQFLN
jgi:hypothetical protein